MYIYKIEMWLFSEHFFELIISRLETLKGSIEIFIGMWHICEKSVYIHSGGTLECIHWSNSWILHCMRRIPWCIYICFGVSCNKVPALEFSQIYGIYTFRGYPVLHILLVDYVLVWPECIPRWMISHENLLNLWNIYNPGVPWNIYCLKSMHICVLGVSYYCSFI